MIFHYVFIVKHPRKMTFVPEIEKLLQAKYQKGLADIKKNNLKKVKRGIRLISYYYSRRYQFLFSSFMHDNFKTRNKRLVLKVHDKSLKTSIGKHPWYCRHENAKKIVKTIHHELVTLISKNSKFVVRSEPLKLINVSNVVNPSSFVDKFHSKAPLASNYRKRLSKLASPFDTHNYLFRGAVEQAFYYTKQQHNIPCVLLRHVFCSNNKEITNHAWLRSKNLEPLLQMYKNGIIKKRSIISFFGNIHAYTKYVNCDSRKTTEDFGIGNPHQIHVLKV